MKVALVISVYKNTQDLALVLESLIYQTNKDFDVIVSEDGESYEMKQFINNYNGSFNLIHLYQKDNGWQKNKALNQVISKTDAEYLIFIDGDCLLHPKFIESHISKAEKAVVLAGRRVKLSPKFSTDIRENKNLSQLSKKFSQRAASITLNGGSFVDEGVYSPFLATFRKSKTIKGCNFSCHKASLEKINGFDENYIRPAVGEDTDLDWRFEGVGIKINSVRHLAIQYHLFHKESWTDASENIAYMNQQKAKEAFIAKNGLKKY